MTAALAGLSGAAVTLGILLIAAGLTARPAPHPGSGSRRPSPSQWSRLPHGTRLRVAASVGGGILAWLATGWLLAVPAVPALVLGLPTLLRPPVGTPIARLEALQEWTRSLAGMLTVGVGLEHALIASARSAPTPITAEVTGLAARLRARTPTSDALRWFADALDDATADLIVVSLTRAATRRGQGLTAILESLSASVAHEVSIRRAVDAERAKLRTTTRTVTALTLTVMAGLFAAGSYTDPYRTLTGSSVLGLLLALYITTLAWMRRLGATRRPARLIADPPAAPGPDVRSMGSLA